MGLPATHCPLGLNSEGIPLGTITCFMQINGNLLIDCFSLSL